MGPCGFSQPKALPRPALRFFRSDESRVGVFVHLRFYGRAGASGRKLRRSIESSHPNEMKFVLFNIFTEKSVLPFENLR